MYIGSRKDLRPQNERKLNTKLTANLNRRLQELENELGSWKFRDPVRILSKEFEVNKRKHELQAKMLKKLREHHNKVFNRCQNQRRHNKNRYDKYSLIEMKKIFPSVPNKLLVRLESYKMPLKKKIQNRWKRAEYNKLTLQRERSMYFTMKNEERKMRALRKKLFRKNMALEGCDVEEFVVPKELEKKGDEWKKYCQTLQNPRHLKEKTSIVEKRKTEILKNKANHIDPMKIRSQANKLKEKTLILINSFGWTTGLGALAQNNLIEKEKTGADVLVNLVDPTFDNTSEINNLGESLIFHPSSDMKLSQKLGPEISAETTEKNCCDVHFLNDVKDSSAIELSQKKWTVFLDPVFSVKDTEKMLQQRYKTKKYARAQRIEKLGSYFLNHVDRFLSLNVPLAFRRVLQHENPHWLKLSIVSFSYSDESIVAEVAKSSFAGRFVGLIISSKFVGLGFVKDFVESKEETWVRIVSPVDRAVVKAVDTLILHREIFCIDDPENKELGLYEYDSFTTSLSMKTNGNFLKPTKMRYNVMDMD
eukprot:augustus_masked-scaffold_33-processed-gene-1.38-mRNA-1 protein AED:1.00 eAED:1.00 QI:0/0/0/0/1/1/2/0/533